MKTKRSRSTRDSRHLQFNHLSSINWRIPRIPNQILLVVRDRISRWDINDDQDYDRHSNEDNLDNYLSRGDFARLAPQTPLNNHIINRFLHVSSIKCPDVYPIKCGTFSSIRIYVRDDQITLLFHHS